MRDQLDATVAAASMSVSATPPRARSGTARPASWVTGGGIGTPDTPVNDYLQVSGPLDQTGRTENTIDGHVGVFWYGNVFNASAAAREYKVFALGETINTISDEHRPGKPAGQRRES